MERDPHTRNGWLLVIAFYLIGGLACWMVYEKAKPHPIMGEPYPQLEAEAASTE